MILRPAATSLRAFRISPGDTNRLAVVVGPEDGADVTIAYEVWEPGGAQPPNSHPRSVETFLFLRGSGVAVSDGAAKPVGAGDLLALPAGSVHHIRNVGPGRLYAITTMVPDDGFAALIRAGTPDVLDDDDLAVLGVTAGS
jgi:mannose-6-phosphate isomerase-like protein (cupin superfamily)